MGSRESLLHTISPGLIVQNLIIQLHGEIHRKCSKKQKSGIYSTLSLSMVAIYTAQADHIKRPRADGQCFPAQA